MAGSYRGRGPAGLSPRLPIGFEHGGVSVRSVTVRNAGLARTAKRAAESRPRAA